MEYRTHLTPFLEDKIIKIKKKDRVLYERLMKKIAQIAEKPEHYKPLRGDLAGKRRTHMDPFVLIFEVKGDLITFHYVKHHDKAY